MNTQLSLGMAANPRTWPLFDGTVKPLETAAQYSAEQGLIPRLLNLDEVFAESTMKQ